MPSCRHPPALLAESGVEGGGTADALRRRLADHVHRPGLHVALLRVVTDEEDLVVELRGATPDPGTLGPGDLGEIQVDR